MYNFTEFAVQLNQPEEGVAPTDSRLRPDQRLMEEAKWDEANMEKLRLEEKQRTIRKQRELAAAEAHLTTSYSNSIDQNNANSKNNEEDDEDIDNMIKKQAHKSNHDPEATWFKKTMDPYTNLPIHVFKNEYWECKANQDWKRCPDIY
jgi:hypothetical protein